MAPSIKWIVALVVALTQLSHGGKNHDRLLPEGWRVTSAVEFAFEEGSFVQKTNYGCSDLECEAISKVMNTKENFRYREIENFDSVIIVNLRPKERKGVAKMKTLFFRVSEGTVSLELLSKPKVRMSANRFREGIVEALKLDKTGKNGRAQ